MPEWPIAEPSPHVADLFARYQSGEPGARQQLAVALYRHRGTRFLTDTEVFWLFKRTDLDDDAIGVCPRSVLLTERGNHEHRHAPRPRLQRR